MWTVPVPSDTQKIPHPPSHNTTLSKPVDKSKRYFCTFCSEEGIEKVFKTKQDWKRHEEDYHVETGLQWTCEVKGCSGVFPRGVEFKSHLKQHEGKKLPRDWKNVHQLDRIYACGFENCKRFHTTWKQYCNHVAEHMDVGDTVWTFNRTIQNLLKHPDHSALWKHTYNILCPQMQILHSDLSWEFHKTRGMRDQLACRSFEGRLDDFLPRLFQFGLPPAKANLFSGPPQHGPSSSLYTTPPTLPPFLPSSVDLTNFDHFVGVSNEVATPVSDYRNSIFMTDAPTFHADEYLYPPPTEPFGEVPTMSDEQITCGNFITEVDGPYLPHGQSQVSSSDHGKSHSPRTLMAKGKEWFASKTSQHSHHSGIDHPDLPADLRLPTSSPRKKSHTSTPRILNYHC